MRDKRAELEAEVWRMREDDQRKLQQRAEEQDAALTYDYPMFSKPMTSGDFIAELTTE